MLEKLSKLYADYLGLNAESGTYADALKAYGANQQQIAQEIYKDSLLEGLRAATKLEVNPGNLLFVLRMLEAIAAESYGRGIEGLANLQLREGGRSKAASEIFWGFFFAYMHPKTTGAVINPVLDRIMGLSK